MPPRTRSLAGVVRIAEEILRRNHVDHVFVGALSVLAFGHSRTTRDVDVIVRLRPAETAQLAADFRREGFLASERDLRAALREGGHSTLEDTKSVLRIDLALGTGYAAQHSLRHAVRIRWRGIDIPIAPPEHTIVMKLKFGSPQDLEDALSILAEQRGALDLPVMIAFARRERVLGALEDLMEQARPPSQG